MAFATSNVQTANMGSLNALVGDFTATAGDADGTVTVGGARIYSAHFYDGNDTTPTTIPLPVKISLSEALSTVTVNVSGGVTAGRFIVIYK